MRSPCRDESGFSGRPSTSHVGRPSVKLRKWPTLVATSTSSFGPFQVSKGLAHQLFTGLFFAAGAVVGPSGVDVTAAGVQRGMQGFDADLVATIVFDGQRHFAVAMAVVENGPRLRNNAMVIPFNSNETVCVRFQRKQNAGFTARRTSRHPSHRTSHRNRSRRPSRSWRNRHRNQRMVLPR